MHNKSYPLTREQQGLWIEWKISPEGLSYNTCVQLKLQGDLDVVRFCRTASDVVDYFELLRSYCVPLNDQVYLAFSQQPYQLETIDLWAEYRPGSSAEEGESSDLEPEELKQRALKILDEKRQVSLNLTRFPLISAALIKTAPRTYYFTGVVPHLISDGASAIYFLMAFSTAYNRGRQALIDEFSEKNHSWGDYLQRRSELDSERDEMAARQYWAQYLSGAVHRIELSHSTESPEDSVGKREHLQLSQDVSTKLKALARKNRTSLFSVMAALFATLLYRYSTQQDFLVGYPVDLRPRGFRNAFGLFVNIIPLRIRLEADFSFNQLIATIHQQRKADKAYQYLPSLEIVKAHRIDTPEFDGRMFNVSMAETVSRLQNLFLDNIASEPLDTERVDIRDDLVWMYENTEEGIGIWLEFREILFDAAARARIMAQVNRLIASVVQAPEQVITGIELSSPLERTVLLKIFDEKGFIFFTNYNSQKSKQIGENANVSLLFPWTELERQVEINGVATKISTAESLKYFLSRPRGSQLGAWASAQSSPINSRQILEGQLQKMKSKFTKGEIPLPDFWGGYRVVPETIEFWQGGANRLHDRFEYTRDNSGWISKRLQP